MRKYQTHMTGRRLRDALPQPQEYACLLTPDGFLARVSPDLERDFGPAAQSLHGAPFSTLVQDDDQVAVRAALSWIRDDGAPVVFECRWHHTRRKLALAGVDRRAAAGRDRAGGGGP